ncbi:hypothetical protein L9F63_010426, partial [Diploptera punctata]
FIWLVIFLVFLIGCIHTAVNMSKSFFKNAVLIEVHVSQVELDIHRPAISICNRHTYLNKSAWRDYGFDHFKSLTYYYVGIMYPTQIYDQVDIYMSSTYCVNNPRCPPLKTSLSDLYK